MARSLATGERGPSGTLLDSRSVTDRRMEERLERVDDGLPLALRTAWWATAWLRGHVVTDLLLDAVIGEDATHVVAGLGGPPTFNAAALEAGQAVVASGAWIGLVPARVGAAVTWHAYPAERRQLP